MSTELKEAAEKALVVLGSATSFMSRKARDQHESVVAELRTDIQQAEGQQPATGEPVADVRCEGCGYMTHQREHMGCVRAAKQHIHPAPGMPDDVVRDAKRYRWLRSLEHCNEAWCFIGSGNANSNLDAAIHAASKAQKGGA